MTTGFVIYPDPAKTILLTGPVASLGSPGQDHCPSFPSSPIQHARPDLRLSQGPAGTDINMTQQNPCLVAELTLAEEVEIKAMEASIRNIHQLATVDLENARSAAMAINSIRQEAKRGLEALRTVDIGASMQTTSASIWCKSRRSPGPSPRRIVPLRDA